MRKQHKILIVVLLLAITIFGITSISGNSNTTNTFALNRKGEPVITQAAYLPDKTLLDLNVTNFDDFGLNQDYLALSKPQDMFVSEDNLIYIADSGNARIVVFDPELNDVVNIIEHEEFSNPRGIFINEDNILYVADSSAGEIIDGDRDTKNGSIFIMTTDGTLVSDYTEQERIDLGIENYTVGRVYRPTSPSFGETEVFAPKKIGVDGLGTMYIIGEGLNEGILQLSSNGGFLGYFASNDVVLTTRQQLENLLFSDEQKETTVDRTPIGFSNVYVDKRGIKYSTSHGEDLSNLQKHNTDGSSSVDTDWGWDMALVDVYTDQNNVIYTASDEGYIYIFTSDGQFIFGFGTISTENVVGFYEDLVSIAIDNNGVIWTLDQENAYLQSYQPTEYTNRIYSALNYYREGNYTAAVGEWEEVLKLNQMSVLAHREIGRNLVGLASQGDENANEYYKEAMEHFIISGDRAMYSEAYWQVRYQAMQEGFAGFIIAVVAFVVVFFTVKFTNRKWKYLDTPKKYISKVKKISIINDLLFTFSFIKHPLDSFYYLKKKEKGSYKGAALIFALFFIIYMISVTSKGFIYQTVEPADLDLGGIVLGFFSIFILFILSNYLVTSINDGEGGIGEIFKGVAYALMPMGISLLAVTFLSHYLTYDEVIFLDIISIVGTYWTALLIFLAVQELHNYTIRETIKSFLLTFLFMLIIAVLFSFIQIMGDQLIQFIIALFEEAIRNVFS